MYRSIRLALALFVTLLGLSVLPSPGTAVVIDSFTDALPPNPLLTASGRTITVNAATRMMRASTPLITTC